MKKSTQNNSFIKKQLRKRGIHVTRITNGAGVRVWRFSFGDETKESQSLRAIANEYIRGD